MAQVLADTTKTSARLPQQPRYWIVVMLTTIHNPSWITLSDPGSGDPGDEGGSLSGTVPSWYSTAQCTSRMHRVLTVMLAFWTLSCLLAMGCDTPSPQFRVGSGAQDQPLGSVAGPKPLSGEWSTDHSPVYLETNSSLDMLINDISSGLESGFLARRIPGTTNIL